MPYFLVNDFKAGLDLRKSVLTAPAGTLTRLVNASITPGGEIQKRRAFVKVAHVPGTFGLAAIGKTLATFTKNTTPDNPGLKDPTTGKVPTDVSLEYHRLPNESPTSILTDYDVFDGKLYAVLYDATPSPPKNPQSGATLPPGIPTNTTYHQDSDNRNYYWNGTGWTEWTAKSRGDVLKARGYEDDVYLCLQDNIYYEVRSTDWQEWRPKNDGPTLPASAYEGDTYHNTTDNTYWEWKAGKWVPWVQDGTVMALASPAVEGDTFYNTTNKTIYITKNSAWELWKADYTVATLPDGIKDKTPFYNTTTKNYYEWDTNAWVYWKGAPPTASSSGTTLPATGTKDEVFYKTDTKETYVYDGTAWQLFKVDIRLQNPHYYYDDRDEVNDQFQQNADLTWSWTTKKNPNKGTYQETEGSGYGLYVRSYKAKVYTVGDKYLRFSAVNDAFLWAPSTDTNDTTRTGAGYINVSLQEGGSAKLQGVEIYYDKLALMSELTTQIWSVVSDPLQNALGQMLRQTGTSAPWSVQQYGSGDILFLNSSGIRSLKARDISNSAAVSDIGSPIDDYIRTIPVFDRSMCRSVLEPIVGRIWFAFKRHIAVLSFFPGPNIVAWSIYTTDFDIDYAVACGDYVFLRSGDDIYMYGGVDGLAYDKSPVEVRLPYHDGSKPGHQKMYQGIDVTAWGEWDIKVSYNYDLPDEEEPVAHVKSPTWNKGRYELEGFASHASFRFYNATAEKAQIANFAIHWNMAEDTD